MHEKYVQVNQVNQVDYPLASAKPSKWEHKYAFVPRNAERDSLVKLICFGHYCAVRFERFRPKTREELQNELYRLEKQHRLALNKLKARRCVTHPYPGRDFVIPLHFALDWPASACAHPRLPLLVFCGRVYATQAPAPVSSTEERLASFKFALTISIMCRTR